MTRQDPTKPDSLIYSNGAWPNPELKRLYRCGQHYHLPVENPQGCPGETSPADEVEPGLWVEVHTVYSAKVSSDCRDPESLDCCTEGPFVVRAFAARVTEGEGREAISIPTGLPRAEWLGSTTGHDKVSPDQCNPAAAWSFNLGCHFRVSKGQLSMFKEAHKARPLQPYSRVSRDLALVVPAGTPAMYPVYGRVVGRNKFSATFFEWTMDDGTKVWTGAEGQAHYQMMNKAYESKGDSGKVQVEFHGKLLHGINRDVQWVKFVDGR